MLKRGLNKLSALEIQLQLGVATTEAVLDMLGITEFSVYTRHGNALKTTDRNSELEFHFYFFLLDILL